MFIIKLPVHLALLLASGEMPAASIKWWLKVKVQKHRVLIYAEDLKKPLSSYPVEWQMIILNAELFGNIPHFVDQVENAIVGWADIAPHAEVPKVWNYGENVVRFINAHTLDDPFVCNIKDEGFDTRFSYDDFAAHRKMRLHIYAVGNSLFVPVNARIWEQSANGTILAIYLIGEATKWLITEDDALREYDSVVIYHNNMYREFKFSSRNCITTSLDGKGNLLTYHSVLRDGKKVAKTSVLLYLEDELDT